MHEANARDRYWQPNAHLVAALASSGDAGTLVASHDIVDAEGTKLWSRDQPISQTLQRKLLERRLVKPLESCLRIANGVTPATLAADLRAVLDEGGAVAALARPHAATLLAHVEALPLHAVAQLLLSTARDSRPGAHQHAVAAMTVAGALAADAGWSRYDLRLALLGGLLHDVGELYLDPALVDGTQALSAPAFRQLSVHPSVGAMLLGSQTDYPSVLQRAVAEHHERLDGTGYPLRSVATAQSGLGRLLAAVEVATGILASRPSPLARAALALRLVPGEFEPAWSAALARAARDAREPGAAAEDGAIERMGQHLDAVTRAVQGAAGRTCAPPIARLLQQAGHALARLTVGWNSVGLWSGASAAVEGTGAGMEAGMVIDEVVWRLRHLARHTQAASATLPEADARQLARLCGVIGGDALA